ncbi:MAG: succinate dehydrogenase iron-sulfur subunit, partial [Anaerolineales bacterium]|nr:succinate dehydrogenase iron-sulfur subunit [Anaerolineales bacterium]
MQVQLRIRRFNPEKDKKPWWGEYTLQDVHPTDTVLDLLNRVKWEIDGTLSMRRSCAHGVCGSDAMRINGANGLACKTLVKNLAAPGATAVTLQVEPILGLPVLKDLIVDMEPFLQAYKNVKPFLITTGEQPSKERIQSAEERAVFDDTTKC